jgi:hypothetical protein
MRNSILASSVAASLLLPTLAFAEATVTNPATTNSTATAHLDVAVVIPPVLSLRVGTGGAVNVANATIDSLTFTVPAASIGNSTPVAAGVTDGDLGNGAVTVRVYSNVGTNVNLNSSVTGALQNTAGNTIGWNKISVAAAALASTTTGFINAAITHPAFNTGAAGGSGTATSLPAVSSLVLYEGKWTYSYANDTVLPGGTYGTSARNGRVTYTVTQL